MADAAASIVAVVKQSSEAIAPQRMILMVVPFNDAAVSVAVLSGRDPEMGPAGAPPSLRPGFLAGAQRWPPPI